MLYSTQTAPTSTGPATSQDDTAIPTLRIEERPASGFSENRALWMLVGIGLLWWSWQLIGSSALSWTVPILVVCNIWGLVTILIAWLPENALTLDHRFIEGFQWATALMTVAGLVVWGVVDVGGLSPYGTDAMAFNQYAAQLAQHGWNPYAHSMQPAFALFRTPTTYYTYGFNGVPVTALSYPAQSFLIYVPFLAINWTQNLAPLINIFAWGLTILLMFALVPRRMRPIALIFGGVSIWAQFAIGGVTDVLFMPLMVLAAYRWDRFGTSRMSYIGPIMFGLAMGIKQNAWPTLPFLLIALCLDEYRSSNDLGRGVWRSVRYLLVALAALLVPNLPYFISDPHAWIHGVLTPLFANMVPTGQGSISLSLYLHMGGGSVAAFTIAAVFVVLLLLGLFVGTYPLLRGGFFVLPALAFFFADRSNMNYFISLIPIGFIAAATVQHPPVRLRLPIGGRGLTAWAERALSLGGWVRSRRWGAAIWVLAALSVAAIVYSLSAPQPLRIKIARVQTTGPMTRIEQMWIRVTNTSGTTLKPSFDVLRNGYNSTFWRVVNHPKPLRPGATVEYALAAENGDSEPSVYGGFSVVGYADSPESFSVSSTYDPNLEHLLFTPSAVDQRIPAGEPFTVRVQVYRRSGGVLHRAGVKVQLSQRVWTDTGARTATSWIDCAKRGKHSSAYTNSQGIAEFQVEGSKATRYPVTYTAQLFDTDAGYVYSDSGDLNISYGPSAQGGIVRKCVP